MTKKSIFSNDLFVHPRISYLVEADFKVYQHTFSSTLEIQHR
jgi:hypothetical protein